MYFVESKYLFQNICKLQGQDQCAPNLFWMYVLPKYSAKYINVKFSRQFYKIYIRKNILYTTKKIL